MVITTSNRALNSQTFDFGKVISQNRWSITNDAVMGGLSTGQVIERFDHVEFFGEISLENNGGFTSTYYEISNLPTNIQTVTIDVMGDGNIYQFRASTKEQSFPLAFKHEFSTQKGVRNTFTLKLADFVATFRGRVLHDAPPLSADNIYAFGFLLNNKKAGAFKLNIYQVTFQ